MIPRTSSPSGHAGARVDAAHTWHFFRAGGVDQVLFQSGADIARLGQLDQKLWVALACPTRGLAFDERTLDLIDTDRDGRIRPPELIAACEWACAHLRDPDLLLRGGDAIALEDIADPDHAETLLTDEARRILALRGREGAGTLTLQDVTDRGELLAGMRFNGDGVITVETAADDAAARHAIAQIVATRGTLTDRGGQPGIDRARAEAFYADAHALSAWQARAADDDGGMPLGAGTLAAAEAVKAVRDKVDDFFARCRVAAYDERAVPALNPSTEVYEAIGAQALHVGADSIARLPLAPVAPGRSLPLADGVNPAWADALRQLQRAAVQPLLGDERQELSEAQWQEVQRSLAPCQDWLAAKPDSPLAALAPAELAPLLEAEAAVMELIAQDEQVEPHNARLADLEKLLRLQRDLVSLLHNFVSFKAFYQREGAIFQAGTLYLDGRSCDLAVHVDDVAKHAVLAGLAKTCLAYCQCTREGKRITIVAAFTAGDTDFLLVGRNGVFYDRQGHDWDATITRVIENPTSVAQAFFSPYKKFLRLIEEQVAKRAAASDAVAQGSLSTMAARVATVDKPLPAGDAAKAPAATAPFKLPGRVDVGTVAALGVALGSISAVLVAIFSKVVDLGQWIPIALVGVVMAISGPSMLIAWLKLRQRSLGPILDAGGWAINGRMRVNVRLGGSLSKTARLPPHASRVARDPFAEPPGWRTATAALLVVLAAGLLAWRMDWLDANLPQRLQHTPGSAATAPGPAG
ncbi:MAG: hypothetical protein EOP81_19310 [Variovorax sp.]|nr:MAG: hypothetical protein EOP81_19310 [Variovorax sp.]